MPAASWIPVHMSCYKWPCALDLFKHTQRTQIRSVKNPAKFCRRAQQYLWSLSQVSSQPDLLGLLYKSSQRFLSRFVCCHDTGTGTVVNKPGIKQYQQATRDRSKSKTEGGKIIRVEAHPIPEHPRPRRVKGRCTLVGDAAGYVTKCSGEGIYFAAKSGRMAAEAIVEGSAQGQFSYFLSTFLSFCLSLFLFFLSWISLLTLLTHFLCAFRFFLSFLYLVSFLSFLSLLTFSPVFVSIFPAFTS